MQYPKQNISGENSPKTPPHCPYEHTSVSPTKLQPYYTKSRQPSSYAAKTWAPPPPTWRTDPQQRASTGYLLRPQEKVQRRRCSSRQTERSLCRSSGALPSVGAEVAPSSRCCSGGRNPPRPSASLATRRLNARLQPAYPAHSVPASREYPSADAPWSPAAVRPPSVLPPCALRATVPTARPPSHGKTSRGAPAGQLRPDPEAASPSRGGR